MYITVLRLLELQIRRSRESETQVRTVNINSRTANCQCSLVSIKNPIIRIFCISGWLAVPINRDIWSSTVLHFSLDWFNRSLPSFSSTTYQNFPISRVTEKLCSKCDTQIR